MTDKEKVLSLLNDLEIEIFEDYGNSICICPPKKKVIGDSWASVEFNFDKNGRFVNLEVRGD